MFDEKSDTNPEEHSGEETGGTGDTESSWEVDSDYDGSLYTAEDDWESEICEDEDEDGRPGMCPNCGKIYSE